MRILRFFQLEQLYLEQYGYNFINVKEVIINAFENLATEEIVFNEVDGQLHAIIFTADLDITEANIAITALQDPDILGDSIEVAEIKPKHYIKLIIDQKILESRN